MKRTILTCAVLTLFFAMSGMDMLAAGPAKKEIGIQLYSARTLIKQPKGGFEYKTVLDSLSAMGYTDVETANYAKGKFYGATPEQFRKDVESRGMNVLSAHTNRPLTKAELESGDITEALKWWDECIAAHKAAGIKYLIVPSMKAKSLKELDIYCRLFNEIGVKCRQFGLEFGYHNHAHEFEKLEGEVILDYMLKNIKAENFFVELDVYWSMMGKVSAVDYFNTYPGRFKILHIKDLREVGQSGMVGYDAIFRNAEKAGVEHIVVEIERYSYDDVYRSLRESIDYLKKADFVPVRYK